MFQTIPKVILQDIIINSIKSDYLEILNKYQFMLFKLKFKEVLLHIKNMFIYFEDYKEFLYDREDRLLLDYQYYPIIN